MKKSIRCFFVFLGILELSSCSFSSHQDDTSFEKDYARVIGHTLTIDNSYLDISKELYSQLYPSWYDASWLSIGFDLAHTAVGKIFFQANSTRESYQKMKADMILTGSVQEYQSWQISHPNMFDIRGKVIVDGMSMRPYYTFLEKFDLSGDDTAQIVSQASKFIGKWYVFDLTDSLKNVPNNHWELRQFMTGYMAFLKEVQDTGTNGIVELLEKNPLLISTNSGMIQGDERVYPVAFTTTGCISLLNAASLRYSGSWLSQEALTKLSETLKKSSFSGNLSVSKKDPAYFSLSGTIHSEDGVSGAETMQVMIVSQEASTHIVLTSSSGSLDSLYETAKDWFRYSLKAPEKEKQIEILHIDLKKWENENLLNIHLSPPSETGGTMNVQWPTNLHTGDFSLTIGDDTRRNYLDISGKIEKKNISLLDWKFVVHDGTYSGELLSLKYNRKVDDTFDGFIKADSYTIDYSGRAKKEDFLFQWSTQGMTLRIENKKISENDWKGTIQFPVGKMDWLVWIDAQTLRSLKLDISSPVITVNADLTGSNDDWIRWIYTLWAQWEVISSWSLGLLKKPKYTGFHIDTILPGTETPSVIDFMSMVDIVYDKNVKIDLPEGAVPFDMSSFSSAKNRDTDRAIESAPVDFTNS